MAEQIVGITLAGCKIIKLLGKGGMGSVYLGRQIDLGRFVAVKVLSKNLIQEEGFLRRFKREARAVASLSHPNIVQVYQYGEEDGIHFIVMEYVEGETLGARLTDSKTLEETELIRIARQAAIGIQEAQEKNIVHRDIKPDNIILNKDGQVKVTDFGLAKNLSGGPEQSLVTKQIIGTPAYISPEQIKGTEIDPRSDLYSLGATMYHALTGKPPFTAKNPFELLEKHLKEKPVPPIEVRPEISQAISDVVLKCLAKDADRRYQTAAELITDLETLEGGGKIAREGLPPWARRWPVRLGLAAALVAVLAWAGSRWTSSGSNSTNDPAPTGAVNPLPGPDPMVVKQRKFRELYDEGEKLEGGGYLDLALEKYRDALELMPEDAELAALVKDVETRFAEEKRLAAEAERLAALKKELVELKERAFDKFWQVRDEGRKDEEALEETVALLKELVSRDPEDEKAHRYLDRVVTWLEDLREEIAMRLVPEIGGNGEEQPNGAEENGENGESSDEYPYEATVYLKNGGYLVGEVTGKSEGYVHLTTAGGTMSRKESEIEKIVPKNRGVRRTGNGGVKLPSVEELFDFQVEPKKAAGGTYVLNYDFTDPLHLKDWTLKGATPNAMDGVISLAPGGTMEFNTRFQGGVEIEARVESLGPGTFQTYIYTHNVGVSTDPEIRPALTEGWLFKEIRAGEGEKVVHLGSGYTVVNVMRENRRAYLVVDYGDETRLNGEISSGLGSIAFGAKGAGFKIYDVKLKGLPKP